MLQHGLELHHKHKTFMTKVRLSTFELLSYSVKWPPSDAHDDQVLLKAYLQATTLETHTSARTQPVRQCQPELVEALSNSPHVNPP